MAKRCHTKWNFNTKYFLDLLPYFTAYLCHIFRSIQSNMDPESALAKIGRYNASMSVLLNDVLPGLLANTTISSLRELYPDLTIDDFLAKFDEVKSPYDFFRTFVPFYYKVVGNLLANKANSDLLPSTKAISDLLSIVGWCTGDPHMENFGGFYRENEAAEAVESVFTIADIDDSCKAPLVTDALRFFVSVLLAPPGGSSLTVADFKSVLDAYVAGLNKDEGEGKNLKAASKVVKKVLTKSQGLGWAPKNEFEGTANSPTAIWGAMEDIFHNEYHQDWRVVNAMQVMHKKGGSGGLLRFVAEIERPAGGSKMTRIVEFKEEPTLTGVYPLIKALRDAHPEIVLPDDTFMSRFDTSKRIFLHDVDTTYYRANRSNRFNGKDTIFLMRPRYKSNEGVKLEKVESKDELVKLAQFEAFTLGKLHSQAAPTSDVDRYIVQVGLIPVDEWYRLTMEIVRTVQNAFGAK